MFLKTQATRLLGAAWLVIGLAACDGSPTPITTPTPPSPPPQLVPPPPLTVSLTVIGFKATGERAPVPNLRLKVRAEQVTGGAVDGPLADVVADARGRFTINDNRAFVLLFQTDPQSEYRFLCDWFPIETPWTFRELLVVDRTFLGNRPPPGWYGPEGVCGEDHTKTGYNPDTRRIPTYGDGVHPQLTR